ncbi:MAG: response regulator [Alphaproteobacteria bacterium]|nr:response regulator [Alphaproteobacteria bacterium]
MVERDPAERPALADEPHILVVDDDRRLRQLLSRYLSENGFRVTTAADAAQARGYMRGLDFDLLVLDLMMPGESGLDFARSMRAETPVPILMLTAMGEAEDRIAGLERGADDYLVKPFEPRELVLRIFRILERTAARPDQPETGPVAFGECRFDPARDELTRGDQVVRLTTTETGLLRSLALHPGRPLDREALRQASGEAASDRAIDVQVARLRRKIEPDPKLPRYLCTVRGKGYVLRAD